MIDKRIEAFSRTYQRYKIPLYHYVLKVTKSSLIAEDIVHNVFMRYYDEMESIHDAAKTEQWLFRVAYNDCMGHFRRKKIRNEEDLEHAIELASETSTPENFILNETIELVHKQVEELPVEQREIFQLKQYSGMSYREISGILGIGEELVKSRLFKARQKVKFALLKLLN